MRSNILWCKCHKYFILRFWCSHTFFLFFYWQPLLPTQLHCAHFVSTTSVSICSRLRTRLLLHISIVIRLVTAHPDCPHFVCAHSVIHIFVDTLCFCYTKRLCTMPLLHITIQHNQSTTSTPRMIIEMCSKRRVRDREGVETDVVNTKFAQSSCVGKRGCLLDNKKKTTLLIFSQVKETAYCRRFFFTSMISLGLKK